MRALVAGIGNIFLGDDGFGVEVVRRLSEERLGEGVKIADFGIRGIHLAYELTDGEDDAAILIDACSRGGPPGTLYTIEPDLATEFDGEPDPHTLTPDSVIAMMRHVGTPPARIVVVGCEPATLDENVGLSAPVAASIAPAVDVVRNLVAQLAAFENPVSSPESRASSAVTIVEG